MPRSGGRFCPKGESMPRSGGRFCPKGETKKRNTNTQKNIIRTLMAVLVLAVPYEDNFIFCSFVTDTNYNH
jgi:hypothetical protein